MTARILAKLLLGVLCVLVITLVALEALVTRRTEASYMEQRRRDLLEKARMLAELSPTGFAELPHERFQELGRKAGVRITVIARDGTVLADSEADPARMENHAGRPELASALRGEVGSSRRRSPTLGVMFYYVAVPIPSGALRVAVPLADLEEEIAAMRKETLLSMVYAFVPAMLVAAFLARRFSSRLSRIIQFAGHLADGGFRKRLNWRGRDELALLASKLDETAAKLEHTFDQLTREHQELERMERVRRDFIINVSHELRTPLASIQGYTETLLNGAVNDPEHNLRFLQIIRANAERLANLANDLLTLSRLELKLHTMEPARWPVNRLLEECVENFKPMAGRKRIALEAAPAPEGASVYCDAGGFHQALGNLLDNAVKFTPEGGRVEVSAARKQGEDGRSVVEIRVRDTGPGIPEQDLPRLFERFYRVDKARSRELGGTGLGLSIVKHVVKAMGGTVRVESTYGEGAVFSFTVPAADNPSPAGAPADDGGHEADIHADETEL